MNPSLLLLAASLFVWGVGEGMFTYIQPLYLQQLGADPLKIGVITSAFLVAMTVAHIPAGRLADRIGRRPMLIAAWVIGLAAAWVMALARDLNTFIAGMLLYGFTAFVSAPMSSYATAARGRMPVERALTLVSMSFSFGVVFGPTLGGWIGQRMGIPAIYTIAACIFIVSTALILFLPGQPRDVHDPSEPPARLHTNPRFISFLGIAAIVIFAGYLPQPLTQNFLQNERGLNLVQIGLLGTAAGLGTTLLNLLLGSAFRARTGYLIAQALTGIFALLVWRGTGMPAYALAYFMLGGYRAARPLAAAQVRPLIHESQMGLAYGIAETVQNIPAILTPTLAGLIYGIDPELIYPISLVAIALAFFVTLAFSPRGPDTRTPVPVTEDELRL
jgi:MFS family permease